MNGLAHNAASLDDTRMASWVPSPGSADADYLNEQSIITPRARDLVRNNPIAAGVDQTLVDNVIGSQLRLSAQPKYRLLGQDKDWATEWGNTTEDQFETWADTTDCDASRTQTLLGMTRLALSGAMVNGDALALVMWMPRADSRWSTRLQMIEADRLATPPWLMGVENIRGGIEQDKYGAPIAYWINKIHPGDKYGLYTAKQDDWERIPAFTRWGRRRVIHLCDKKRDRQSRGKSVFAPVMREFKVAGEYLGAELHAAAANALIAAFLESDLDQQSVAEIFGADSASATGYWQTVAEKYNRKKMESGMFLTLPVGTRLSGYNPNRPNTAFDGFMESIMRHMAAGLNMPYELLLKDFSKTNYSSARAALLEAWRYFLSTRKWLQDYWLNPIYEAWLEEAINAEWVDAPDFYDNRYAYRKCRWVFSGRGWVDPVKEANAAQLRMESGLSTLEQECAEQGLDWEEVLEQRARERARMAELDLLEPYQMAVNRPIIDNSQPEPNPTAPQDNNNAHA